MGGGVTNQDDESEKIQNLANLIYIILSISGGEVEDLVCFMRHPLRTHLMKGNVTY